MSRLAMTRLAAVLSGLVWWQTLGGAALAQSAATEIEAVISDFERAFNARDASAMADLYTDSAAILPPDSPRIDGREEIGRYWRDLMDAGLSDLALDSHEIIDSGDFAYEVGEFSLAVPAPGGTTSPVGGKYLVIWTKDDAGNWRLHRDIWNIGPSQ